MLVGNRVAVCLTCSLNYPQVHMSLMRNIHDFILDGKSCRQGWATAQTPNELTVSGVRITTSIYCAITSGGWSLVTD